MEHIVSSEGGKKESGDEIGVPSILRLGNRPNRPRSLPFDFICGKNRRIWPLVTGKFPAILDRGSNRASIPSTEQSVNRLFKSDPVENGEKQCLSKYTA